MKAILLKNLENQSTGEKILQAVDARDFVAYVMVREPDLDMEFQEVRKPSITIMGGHKINILTTN